MRKDLIRVLVGVGVVGVVALALGISTFLFSLEPALVSHAQETPVIPIGLPPTGFGQAGSGGFDLTLWIGTGLAGIALLAAGIFLAARRSKAES